MKSKIPQIKEEVPFISPSRGRMSFDALIYDLVDYMKARPDQRYVIGVGTDSKLYLNRSDFVSAIFIHRVGHGARYFYRKTSANIGPNLAVRMMQEASFSLELGQKLIERLKAALLDMKMFRYNIEIHVDIGEKGETKKVIKEIVGMVTGSGFVVKIKPDAVCATTVADRHT